MMTMVQRRSKYFLFLLPLVLLIQAAVAVPSKLIRVGIYHNPPLSFWDEDSVSQGFVVDILREAAKEENWNLEFVFCEWKDCLLALEAGDIDLLGPIAYSEERVKRFDFSEETLITNWGQVYVQSGETDVSILDLDKKILAVVEDDIHTKKLRGQLLSFDFTVDFIFVDDYDAVMLAIENGKAFGGIVNHLYALQHAADYDVVQSAIIYNPIEVRFAATKGKHIDLLSDLDTQVAIMKRDNSSIYYQRLNIWFDNSPKYGMPLWAKWAVGFLFISIITLILRSKFLRSTVIKRTEALEETEIKYQELVNNSLVGICILQDQTIQFCNQGLATLYGYDTPEEMIGISVENLATSESLPKVKREIALRETGQKKTSHYRAKGIQRDGVFFDIEIVGVGIQYKGKPAVQEVLLDITDRVRAEERFKGLSEASFEAIFISEKGICVEVNLAAESLFGYSLEEFIGMSGSDIFILEDRNKVIANLLAGYKEPYHATALRKDGTIFPAEMRGRTMHYRGRAVRVSSIRDISEQVKAEKALQESEEKYRVFFKNNDAIILFVNPKNGKIIFANDAASQFYGYAEEDLLEMSVMDFNVLSPKEIKEKMKEAVKKNQNHFLFTHILANGELRDVEVYQTKLFLNDQVIFSIIVHDITERIRAEQALLESKKRFKKLSNLTFEGILLHNKGIVLDMNESLTRMFGFSREEIIGKNIIEVLVPQEYHAMIQEKMAQNYTLPYEFMAKRKDETLIPVEVESMDVESESGNYRVTAIRDITERVKSEKKIRESESQLNKAQSIAHFGSWELDLKDNTLSWSDEVYRIFGLGVQEFEATYEAFLGSIHPDDREFVNNAYTKSVEDKEPYNTTHRLSLDDGTIKFVRERCETFYDGDNAIRSIGTIQDITEQVMAEEFLKKIETV